MVSPETIETFKNLKSTQYGQALLKVLEEEADLINDASTVKSWDEALERKGTAKLIKKILSLMGENDFAKRKKGQYE